MKMTHDDSPDKTTCDLCEKTFENRQKMLYHKKNSHAENGKGFKCHYCDEVFAGFRLRKGHMHRTHIEYRKCKFCGHVFTRHDCMLRHITAVHEKSESFQCHLCEKTFTAKGYLEAHIKTHPGNKPFKCKLCNSEFSQRTNYNKHLDSHGHRSKNLI